MSVEIFGCNLKLLCGPGGEQCFEQARASSWFQNHSKSTLVEVFTSPEIVSKRSELPMEAVLMRRYAQNLMAKYHEEYMITAWDDPFLSAEIYIHLRCVLNEPSTVTTVEYPADYVESDSSFEKVICRRKAVHFERPPVDSSEESIDGSIGNENDQAESCSPLKHTSLENRQSELSELPTKFLLKRKDCHLIDVSNYFLERSVLANDVRDEENTSDVITQLFSPRQVQELLLKQTSSLDRCMATLEKETPGVDPWCSKFANLFWAKVAPRMSTWSGYFPLEPMVPSNSIFRFGQQSYEVESRLGSGNYGIVYLVHLLPSQDGTTDITAFDTTTVGCHSEEQLKKQFVSNNAFSSIRRVIKLEMPEFPLEFYYMREARRRVVVAFRGGRMPIDVRPSICPALALTHSLGSFTCLLIPFYPVGLLNLLNYGLQSCRKVTSRKSKDSKSIRKPTSGPHSSSLRGMPTPLQRREEELVALYLSLELLWLAEGLHRHAMMIHGDIKPDNFRINDKFPLLDVPELDASEMLKNMDGEEGEVERDDFTGYLMSGRSTKVLVLLDFGLCIDMARFPPDTVFKIDEKRSVKRSFPCTEMLTNQPWTYQLDLFNIAGVIYTLVFKRYMSVECSNGRWQPKYFPRSNRLYPAIHIWQNIFSSLLNVRSCASTDYPDLASLRSQCESFLRANASDYNVAAEKANAIIAYLSLASPSFT